MTRRLFLIGINYIGTPYELSGCINDVENIEKAYREIGFNDVVKRVEGTGKEPKVKETLQDLQTFIKSAKKGDFLAFHYSGHGSQLRDSNSDEKDRQDECICLLDGNVSDDILRKVMVDDLPDGVKLRCLLDCCHSGSGMDLPYRFREQGIGGYEIDNTKSSKKDVVMISGCRDSQTSADAWIEESRDNQGAMTWAWLKTLTWMKKYLPGARWMDIISKMRFTLLKEGYTQVPQLSSTRITHSIDKVEFLSK